MTTRPNLGRMRHFLLAMAALAVLIVALEMRLRRSPPAPGAAVPAAGPAREQHAEPGQDHSGSAPRRAPSSDRNG